MGESRKPDVQELRITIAREALAAMIRSAPPELDMAVVNERDLAQRAVQFADALLEALELTKPGNGR